jgi:hypothetical protein
MAPSEIGFNAFDHLFVVLCGVVWRVKIISDNKNHCGTSECDIFPSLVATIAHIAYIANVAENLAAISAAKMGSNSLGVQWWLKCNPAIRRSAYGGEREFGCRSDRDVDFRAGSEGYP